MHRHVRRIELCVVLHVLHVLTERPPPHPTAPTSPDPRVRLAALTLLAHTPAHSAPSAPVCFTGTWSPCRCPSPYSLSSYSLSEPSLAWPRAPSQSGRRSGEEGPSWGLLDVEWFASRRWAASRRSSRRTLSYPSFSIGRWCRMWNIGERGGGGRGGEVSPCPSHNVTIVSASPTLMPPHPFSTHYRLCSLSRHSRHSLTPL